MLNPKEKTEEAPEWFKLIVKWIFLVIGVPSLAYIFLFTSVQYTFESATTGWQILLGIGLFVILLGYVYFSIKYLVEETKDFFN